MPIYEYQCDNCQYRFDKLQKISDKPLVECPSCQSLSLRKLVSAPAFKLAGTGWYETDFKNKDKKTSNSNSDADNKTTPSAETKTETKKPTQSDNTTTSKET